ncbi:hypothetical protein TWF102_006984 [Orbilia oligospora]|uniref:RING-type domain-containing protein n=1 Tax=Orbilia oligospora TaxID=2813651 RepID=A0A7C8JGJ9_ORBOL|nr:hypothetical protein TWF102_006984 [Orbilia oligospora]
MHEFKISQDGTFDIGDSISNHLIKSLNSSKIPFRSHVRVHLGDASDCGKVPPLMRWKSEGHPEEHDSLELHVVQTQSLDILSGTSHSPTLWERCTIARLIAIISTSITLEITGEVGPGLKELEHWTKLVQLLGRGSDPYLHWGPAPYIYIQPNNKICEPELAEQKQKLLCLNTNEEIMHETAISAGPLSFSPSVLRQALKLLSPIPRPSEFDGKSWLAEALGHDNDWVRHTRKLAELPSLETTDKFNLLVSYVKLEAKSRQIIYGSSITAHTSNILNTIYDIRQSDITPESHYQILSGFSKPWHNLTSSGTCFTCLFRQPEKMLPCGHFTCDRCIQLFGHQVSMAEFKFRIDSCALCSARSSNQVFDLEPPSAGVRLLSLDGGGCRAVITIEVLRQLSDALLRLGIQSAICKNFDLCVGTSAGALILLKMLRGRSCNDQLMEEFKTLASRLFQPRKGYEFLREDNFKEEVEVWEASGRCSAGIPGYFEPMLLRQKGAYFDDGGLRYNNPAGLAINESKRIWELPKNLDILLSVGTGFMKSQPPASRSLLRNRSLLRMGRYFLASLCGEATWQNVEAIVADVEQYKGKFRRVNIELQSDEAAIDDPSVMEPLISKTNQSLQGSTEIIEIANILASSQFYFELDYAVKGGGRIRCAGRILSRLSAGSTSLIEFTRKITGSRFFVPGKSIKCAPSSLVLNVVRGAAFERHVKFSIPIMQPLHFDIQFQLQPMEERRSISGFPANVEFLKTANNISKLRYKFSGGMRKRSVGDVLAEAGSSGSGHKDKKRRLEGGVIDDST